MRLLIPLTVQFSVRYVIRTGLLKLLLPYVKPVIVLGWEDPELTDELQSLGAEVYCNPHKRAGRRYSRIRTRINNWHVDHLDSPTTQIDRYRTRLLESLKTNLRVGLRDLLFKMEGGLPGSLQRWQVAEERLLLTDTNYAEHVELVKKIKPDLVFCTTPYYFEEELLLRAARSMGIPQSTAILSFDNLTTRGYIPILFDEYYLWNRYNESELYRIYPDAKGRKVKIVGAPQFDFYYRSGFMWSEQIWRKTVGIRNGAPVILYGAGPINITPHEPRWVESIDDAISDGEVVGNPVILLRRHPVDSAQRWLALQSKARHIIFDSSWHGAANIGKTNITLFDLEKLTSTLKYSSVHVNASSTMTVDGAIFDRPQIGPAYDDSSKKFDRAMRELYLREHFSPITHSGGVEIARNPRELIRLINRAFSQPSRLSQERKKMVSEICTFSDGKSTERVAESLIRFIQRAGR